MAKFSTVCSLVMCGALSLAAQSSQKPFAIVDVTVIDTNGGPSQPHMTVTVRGNRIASVQKVEAGSLLRSIQTIDGHGKFLIPGLWDMHTHPNYEGDLPLFIANGVTAVRAMWGLPQQHEWREKIYAHKMVGPRIWIASNVIDGPKPVWPGSTPAGDVTEAARLIENARTTEHADFVKLYEQLPRDVFFALVGQAKAQGIPVVGHIPFSVFLTEASGAGYKSVEHLTGILIEASRDPEQTRQLLRDSVSHAGDREWSGLVSVRIADKLLGFFDSSKTPAIFQTLRANATWQVPTLTVLRAVSHFGDPKFRDDPRLKYISSSVRQYWLPANDHYIKTWEPADWAHGEDLFQQQLRIVGDMNRAGVPLLAGTDTNNPFCFSGFSLHDELGLLVRAGLTPVQALQAATRNPAIFLNVLGDYGTVEAGKRADLVLLNGDPLNDIANTQKIDTVIADGRLLRRADLDRLLNEAEKDASLKSIAEPLMSVIRREGMAAFRTEYARLRNDRSYNTGQDALVELAYMLQEARMTREMINVLQLEAKVFPHYWNAFDSLGDAYRDAGQSVTAVRNYREALRLNPSDWNATNQLRLLSRKL